MSSDYLYIPYNEEIICKYSKELPDKDKLSDLFFDFFSHVQEVNISEYRLYSQILWHINKILNKMSTCNLPPESVKDKKSLFRNAAVFCIKEQYHIDFIPPTEYLYELYSILHDIEKVKEFLSDLYLIDISNKL